MFGSRPLVEHPKLGRLERRRGRWRGLVVLTRFGSVPLALPGGRRGPDDSDLALARAAAADAESAWPAIEASLAEHLGILRDGGDSNADIGNPTESVTVEQVTVTRYAGTRCIELALRVAWDEDHTLGAYVRDGQLLDLNGSILVS